MAKQASTPELDQELLEKTAMAIYLKLCESQMRGYDPRVIAQRAYTEARSFVLVTEEIRRGTVIAEHAASDQPCWVSVRLWDGSRGSFGEPLLDETGQPQLEIQPVDRYAYAPNLPEDHPINQRYYPNAVKNRALVERNAALVAARN